ncbi:MAG: hypothetical protein ACREJ0_23985 [Geminicoccaceae bacterium]
MAMVTIDKRRSAGADRLLEVAGDGRLCADDVLRLRRAIYQDGGIDRDKAAALFELNRDHKSHDPAWAEFYVEALSDFFYWREGSDSVLTEDAERMLMEWIGPAEAIEDGTELRLLLSLIFRTSGSSEPFRTYVLDAVRHSVLHSRQALYGQAERQPGVIDAADVEVIRKLVYGLGGQSGMAISAAEAAFLFELNHATAGAANAPAWRDLFVKAVTMHLLFGGGSPDRIDEAEAHWLIAQIRVDKANLDNERALLAYLKQEAGLHPLLQPLCERLGV